MLEVDEALKREDLFALNAKLTPDAQRVLHIIACRMVAGQRKHGALTIETDQRHWPTEMREEGLDLIVYANIADLANDRAGHLAALAATQQRCTELVEEVRALRAAAK